MHEANYAEYSHHNIKRTDAVSQTGHARQHGQGHDSANAAEQEQSYSVQTRSNPNSVPSNRAIASASERA